LASDVRLSAWARSFIARLDEADRNRWYDELQPAFIANPVNETTEPFTEAGSIDVRSTLVGPFLVIWRELNAEVLDIGAIRWA
jgi:hypothetical protein